MNVAAKKHALLSSLLSLVVVGAFSSIICHCQEASAGLKFEVSSIRPAVFPSDIYASGFAAGAAGDPCVLGSVAVSGTLVSVTRVGICDIIRIAYNVKSFQVFGVPSGLGYSSPDKPEAAPARFSPGVPAKETPAVFYDIQARSPGTQPPSVEQVREMLRALLAERFSLKLHREQRPHAFYALAPSAGGPKLKPAAEGCRSRSSANSIQLCGYTMEKLAHFINFRSDRTVVDMTDITGEFDIELPIDRSEAQDFDAVVASVRHNLGLRIDARKGQIEVLVVDHVEKPTAN
jgi:hypothetical protein